MDLPRLTDASLEVSAGIALLTLRRNDVRNALTGTTLVDDIVDSVKWANANPGISVIILTGDGAAFSSGGNVKEMKERTGIFAGTVLDIQDQYRKGIQRLTLAMHDTEIPLIAAVNGAAIGAGMDLACMCDLRVGSTRARFAESFINLGIIPGDGGSWFLQRLLGYQKAAEITLTGRSVEAEEALNLGILLEVTDPGELIGRAMHLAGEIAAKPPRAVRLTKRLLKMAQRQDLPDFLQICACFQAMAHHSDEHMAALISFLEKQSGHKSNI